MLLTFSIIASISNAKEFNVINDEGQILINKYLIAPKLTLEQIKSMPGTKIKMIGKSICVAEMPIYSSCPLGGSVISGWIQSVYNCETGNAYQYNYIPSGRSCRLPVA